MNFGMMCIWLSFIIILIAILLGIKCYINGNYSSHLYLKMEKFSMIIILISVFLLIYYLYTVNTSYVYVFEHSSVDLEWYYKLSALWAGQEGSMLVWVASILVMLSIIKIDNSKYNDPLINLTHIISLVIVAILLMLIIIKNPYSTYYITDGTLEKTNWNPFVVTYAPEFGQGINPLLRNFWMIIHPPVLFFGYAAFTIPFAASISNLIMKDERWENITTNWMRIAWLFLTLGIGLGGFWAYEVLGWGAWYWSWDPVETSSLIPWITATAYLHTQLRHKLEYNFLAPFFVILSFISIIFATFVTRSGIWVSVHSWKDFTLESGVIATFITVLILSSTFLLIRRYLEDENKVY